MLQLIEFPADDLARARRFCEGLLGAPLDERHEDEGRGLQTRTRGVELGVHQRGPGPGDRWSLPYFHTPPDGLIPPGYAARPLLDSFARAGLVS